MTAARQVEAVLGLDPSLTRAGVAAIVRERGLGTVARPGVITDVRSTGYEGAPWWRRSRRIMSQVREFAAIVNEIHAVTPIVAAAIEGPAWGMNSPGTHQRVGLWWALFSVLDAKRIPVTVVNPITRGMFITGVAPNSMPSKDHKELVLAESRAAWFDDAHRIKNHDQADALGMAHMVALHLGWRLPVEQRRRYVENIRETEKFHWETEWKAS